MEFLYGFWLHNYIKDCISLTDIPHLIQKRIWDSWVCNKPDCLYNVSVCLLKLVFLSPHFSLNSYFHCIMFLNSYPKHVPFVFLRVTLSLLLFTPISQFVAIHTAFLCDHCFLPCSEYFIQICLKFSFTVYISRHYIDWNTLMTSYHFY